MEIEQPEINLPNEKQAEYSTTFMLAMLGGFVFLGMLIGGLLSVGYGYTMGMNMQEIINSLNSDSPTISRNFIRINLLINHLTTFVLPALIFAFFFYKNKWVNYLRIDKYPNAINLLLGSVLIIAALPLVQFLYWVNLKIPFPEEIIQLEESTATLVSNLLLVENPIELLLNLLVIAVIPAIGEEMIFRGIIQRKFSDTLKNPHVAIWLTAFIFSAIHMQFQGLFSRMLLGGLLGYLYYWTGNLWVPIIAHFVNNAFAIVGQYLFAKGTIDINLDETVVEVDWMSTVISLVLVFGITWVLVQKNSNLSDADVKLPLDADL